MNVKEKDKQLSSISQNSELRNNLSSVSIDDTGKHPKKEYVLNVRKTDVIQRKNKIRMEYQNDPNAKQMFVSKSNHTIKFIKNVTKDLPTVDMLPPGTKIFHRYNYSSNPNITNTSRLIIDETGKTPKKQKVVSPRKIDVIRSERKPIKVIYENNVRQGPYKIIVQKKEKEKDKINVNIKGKNNKDNSGNINKNESRRSNPKVKESNNTFKNKVEEKTTKKNTENKNIIGKTNMSRAKGNETEIKNAINKTNEKKMANTAINFRRTGNNKNNNKEDEKKEGKLNKFKNKLQPISSNSITVNETDNYRKNISQTEYDQNEEKKSKITLKKSETNSSNGSTGAGFIRLRFMKGNRFGNKGDNKNTSIKTDETITTKIESEADDGKVSKVRMLRNQRRFKK